MSDKHTVTYVKEEWFNSLKAEMASDEECCMKIRDLIRKDPVSIKYGLLELTKRQECEELRQWVENEIKGVTRQYHPSNLKLDQTINHDGIIKQFYQDLLDAWDECRHGSKEVILGRRGFPIIPTKGRSQLEVRDLNWQDVMEDDYR